MSTTVVRASPAGRPTDFRLVLRENCADGYELSSLMLARAGFDGELQLLTAGWERALGFQRGELKGKTLLDLMWSNSRNAATAVAAILGRMDTGAIDLRVRCRDGVGKGLRLHRRYDRREQVIYIVGEEVPVAATARNGEERRALPRQAGSSSSDVA